MKSQSNRHKMLKPLFFIICIVAALALIEAVPWYRQTAGKRYGSAVTSEPTDFGVEEFDVTGGIAKPISGGGLARGKSGVEENQDGLETVTDRHYGYQDGPGIKSSHGSRGGHEPQGGIGDLEDRKPKGGRGAQGGYGTQGGYDSVGVYGGWQNPSGRGSQGGLGQGGRRPQGGRGSQGGYDSVGAYGGWQNPSGRGYPGSQDGIGNDFFNRRDEEDDESGADSDEYPKQTRLKKPCRGCSIANIGNGDSNTNRFFIHDK